MMLLSPLFDFLFPKRCVACDRQGGYLCLRCLSALPRARTLPAPWMSALFAYQSRTVRRSLWMLKYRAVRDIAALFGTIAYEHLLLRAAEEEMFRKRYETLLVPIPMTARKLKERGFNQAALLAEEIARLDRGSLFSYRQGVLEKIIETRSQMTIRNRGERIENMRGAFVAKKEAGLSGTRVLLIDDVVTTGATLAEARTALLAAGARDVEALVIAH